MPLRTLASLCLLTLGLAAAHAQNQESTLPMPLSPASQATLKKLDALKELPPPTWRYHAGDMTHGEAVGLDDSGWAVAAKRAMLPAGPLWLRATIEVPKSLNGYDLTGARLGQQS